MTIGSKRLFCNFQNFYFLLVEMEEFNRGNIAYINEDFPLALKV
jgi:hypothetical protein